MRFVGTYRGRFGVEPICRVLQIAPSGYRRHAAQCRQPERLSARRRRDLVLMPEIQRVWEENMSLLNHEQN